MVNYIAQDTDFTLVANAIRTKTGDSGLLEWPIGFKTAIDNIVDTDCIKTVGPAPVVSVTDAAPLDAEGLVVDIEPVQAGSGDPSPDNVRPISGWTGAKVTRTGKNLLPNLTGQRSSESIFIGQINGLTYPFHTQSGVTYCVSFVADGTSPSAYFKENGGTNQLWGASGQAFTPSKDMDVQLWIYANGLTSVRDTQIELGPTATDYEPYQGDTYDITFPAEAGTVYGGTLDVVNGVLTVDRGSIASYAGETLPSAWISSMDVYTAGGTPTTGAQVVYELATPVTYTLTPQQIALLRGNNTLWADTGDVTLKYFTTAFEDLAEEIGFADGGDY